MINEDAPPMQKKSYHLSRHLIFLVKSDSNDEGYLVFKHKDSSAPSKANLKAKKLALCVKQHEACKASSILKEDQEKKKKKKKSKLQKVRASSILLTDLVTNKICDIIKDCSKKSSLARSQFCNLQMHNFLKPST